MVILITAGDIEHHAAEPLIRRITVQAEVQHSAEGLLVAGGARRVEICMQQATEAVHVDFFALHAAIEPADCKVREFAKLNQLGFWHDNATSRATCATGIAWHSAITNASITNEKPDPGRAHGGWT